MLTVDFILLINSEINVPKFLILCVFTYYMIGMLIVEEGGATRSDGAKRFSAIIAKLRMAKKLLLGQQPQLRIKQIGTKNG